MCISSDREPRRASARLAMRSLALLSLLVVPLSASAESPRVDVEVVVELRVSSNGEGLAMQVTLRSEEPVRLLDRERRFYYLCLSGLARIEARSCDGVTMDAMPRGFLPVLRPEDFSTRREFDFQAFDLVFWRDGAPKEAECVEVRVVIDTRRAIDTMKYDVSRIEVMSDWVRAAPAHGQK